MTDPVHQADLSGSTTPVRLAGSRPRTDARAELALAPWDEFEGRLTRSLASMATDSYLILTVTPAAAGDAHRYVQFAQAGPTGLRAEAVGNGFLPGPDRLTPAQEAALLALVKERSIPVTEAEIERLGHAYEFAAFRKDVRIAACGPDRLQQGARGHHSAVAKGARRLGEPAGDGNGGTGHVSSFRRRMPYS